MQVLRQITYLLFLVTISLPAMEPSKKKEFELDGSTNFCLVTSIYDGDLNALRNILDRGMPINLSNRYEWGNAALHLAASSGQLTILRELIARGADINVQNYGHQTPLYCAVLHGNKDAVKILLKAGADPNIKSNKFNEIYGLGDKRYLIPLRQRIHYPTTRTVDLPIEFDATLYDSPLKITKYSRSNERTIIASALLNYGAEIDADHFHFDLQDMLPNRYNPHKHFRKAILNEQSTIIPFNDQDCLEELETGPFTGSPHPHDVKQGILCAASRGRTNLLKVLPDHLHRVTNWDFIEQLIAKSYAKAFHIAALRGHDSTVHFLLPYASEKEVTITGNTLMHLLRFTSPESQRYKKIFSMLCANTIAQSKIDSYLRLLPQDILAMLQSYIGHS